MNEDRPRYVVDTDVLVSALLFEGSIPGRALRHILATGELLVSTRSAAELQEVLARKKFERYLTADEREEFLHAIVARSRVLAPTESIRACRDPKDDIVLELAIAGRATCILTGDADLLSLNPFRGIPIMTPAEFLSSDLIH